MLGTVMTMGGNRAQRKRTVISTAQNGTRPRIACEIVMPPIEQEM